MAEENNSGVPHEAWLAANAAFESPEWSYDRDELAEALLAASPHIRTDELDALIRMLTVRATQIPLLGRRNNAQREALDGVIQLLTERKSALEEGSP